jgi:hypothetical protein
VLDRRRRKADLVCHRHAVSHAYTTGDAWHQKSMQEFDASNRQWCQAPRKLTPSRH